MLVLPVPNPLRNDSARDPVPEVMAQQRFTKVRVLYGGSEVDNPLRTFFNGVNSRRDNWRVLALNSPEGGGGQDRVPRTARWHAEVLPPASCLRLLLNDWNMHDLR